METTEKDELTITHVQYTNLRNEDIQEFLNYWELVNFKIGILNDYLTFRRIPAYDEDEEDFIA